MNSRTRRHRVYAKCLYRESEKAAPFADNAHVPKRTQTVVVSFQVGPHGYSFVTEGTSVCDVARIAPERVSNDWWKGPRPTPETMLHVSLVGHDQRYRVAVERVRELSRERSAR